MSGENTTTAGSGIVFGLATFKNAVAGVHLQNLTFGETSSTSEALDEDGNCEQIDIYGAKLTVQGDGNVVSGGTIAVSVGATLTINNTAYKINDCSKKFGVNGNCTFSFSGSAPKPAATTGGTTTGGGTQGSGD